MKHVFFLLFLGVAPAMWAMNTAEVEAIETSRKTLQSLKSASRSTCLNINAIDGYPLIETLKIRRSCLKDFASRYNSEIDALDELGLFQGQVTSYNERVMHLLHQIFDPEVNKENKHNISADFFFKRSNFIKDMNELKKLIKEKDNQTTQIRDILEEMQAPLYVVIWMTSYYSSHEHEYLALHR